jgi:type IV secretory pathway TrbL component
MVIPLQYPFLRKKYIYQVFSSKFIVFIALIILIIFSSFLILLFYEKIDINP